MEDRDTRGKIAHVIKTKLVAKRDVYKKTRETFKLLKEVMTATVKDLSVDTADSGIEINCTDFSEFEARLKVGGDTLVFLMHSNVFHFDKSHKTRQNSYVKQDSMRGYCGQIYVYNFLSDSFKHSRSNDLGYLVARIFVNKDLHYFVEGEKGLSFLFNDFVNSELTSAELQKIVDEVLAYCLDFDMHTPPFNQVAVASVDQITVTSQELKLQTGKRLGFKFG